MKKERVLQLGNFSTLVRFTEREQCFFRDENRKSLSVFDTNTESIFGLSSRDRRNMSEIILPAGEEYKNLESVERIFKHAVEEEMSRDDLFFGAGGGVVCDITALAASLYMRGTGCILVPSSLLAMVDASLGGKTGIDYAGYKNLVGTFYPASEVRICTDLLDTLPEKEYLCGIAEVIKHALLGDQELLILLERNKERVLSRSQESVVEMVARSVDIKGDIVESDFREEGKRAYLNLGHTFGHALESSGGFGRYSHGEAVAWGINAAMLAGYYLGITPEDYRERVKNLLEEYGFRLSFQADPGVLMNIMKGDKKKRKGTLRFVLQKGLGETIVTELDRLILERVLRECTQ